MSIHVTAVRSRRQLRRFLDFQYDLYKGNLCFVPPLRMDVRKTLSRSKNPFFEHGDIGLFLASDQTGIVLGRIAAIYNGMHLRKYDDGNGFFGFFEVVDNYAIARALLDAAGQWLASKGLTGVRGPTNPSMNDTAGLLVDGFDRAPSILMPYNPPYYQDFLVRYGFERAMTMWAYYLHRKIVRTDKLDRGVSIVMRRNPGISLRTIDIDNFYRDARIILDIYNDAWANNWGHVPMTESEFLHLAKDMKQIIDPSIVYILEDNGEPVAFSISLPNLNAALQHVADGRLLPLGLPKLLLRAKFGGVHECRTLLMGVRQQYQGKGLDALLNHATIHNGPLHGYDASELSWVLDSNGRLKNSIADYGGIVDKEYAMYEMQSLAERNDA